MQHYFMFSHGNVYADKQLNSKALAYDARGPIIIPHRVFIITVFGMYAGG